MVLIIIQYDSFKIWYRHRSLRSMQKFILIGQLKVPQNRLKDSLTKKDRHINICETNKSVLISFMIDSDQHLGIVVLENSIDFHSTLSVYSQENVEIK